MTISAPGIAGPARWALRGVRRFVFRPVDRLAIASAALLLVMGIGASPVKDSAQARQDSKCWLDARHVCIWRLGTGPMPQSDDQLSAALAQGWKGSIILPDPTAAVLIEGGVFPAIGSLRINLSDGQLVVKHKSDKIRVNDHVERSLAVGRLDVRGQPLLLRQARLNMQLTADDASIALERDRRGRPVMMLSDAKSGALSLDVSRSDLESLLLQNARETASKFGITVEQTRLNIVPQTPRSFQASLYLRTKVAFIPAGMLFRAHMTIDDDMNARITGLTCDGDEALGPIIVGLLRPALANYNGKTRRLVSFPAGKLRLRDVALKVDDSLHITASFGS